MHERRGVSSVVVSSLVITKTRYLRNRPLRRPAQAPSKAHDKARRKLCSQAAQQSAHARLSFETNSRAHAREGAHHLTK